jgi:hypothetical protein
VTLGEIYCTATLVRVVGEMTTGPHSKPKPFCAGILIDPATQRAVFSAPILKQLRGATADQLRHHFARMGWRATIVQRQGEAKHDGKHSSARGMDGSVHDGSSAGLLAERHTN